MGPHGRRAAWLFLIGAAIGVGFVVPRMLQRRTADAPAAGPEPVTSLRRRAAAPPVSVATSEASRKAPAELGTRPEPRRPETPLNVLLVVVDSLRADMPWTGYHRPIAPFLTEFARRGVSYSRAYAISSTTSRSIGPLLTGRYPSEMQRSGDYFTRWYPENVFVSERLRGAGHRTLALHGHLYFAPKSHGLDQGFQDYALLPRTRLNNTDPDNKTARRTTETAQRMLERVTAHLKEEQRFFAYVHYMDPHAPYLAHQDRPSFGSKPRDLYDQEVHYTDEWIKELVSFAQAQPWGRRLAVIITSDHGEAFGEHAQHKHGYELWEELIRVPLLVQVPGAEPQRIDQPRSHVDLAPTILELMSLPPAAGLRGKSLVPELFGAPPERRLVIADLPRDDLQDRRRAIIDGDLKLIAFGDDERFALFDLAADPHERRNLVWRDRKRFRYMQRRYEKLDQEMPTVEVRGKATLKGAPEGQRW